MNPRIALAVGLVMASCTEKAERPMARTPAAPAATVTIAAPPEAGAIVAAADPKRIQGDPVGLAFLEDGSLAIASDDELVVANDSGVTRRVPLRGRSARLFREDAPGEGIVLEGKSEVVLLETPTLRELYSGPGYPLTRPDAIVTSGATTAVMMQQRGKLLRFVLPPGKAKRVDAMEITASGKHAVVTWALEDTMDADAAVFETASGRMIGRVRPMPLFSVAPTATIAGDVQVAIDKGSTVVVIDLATASVVRSAKVSCPKDSFLGNPRTEPGADLMLVTCGSDGITLDAKTLATRRRISRIMPGCDNGETLPAHFDPKAKNELVLEGCGGIARLDLASGRYRCSDEIGLAGAEYEIVPAGPNGPTRHAPPGRENLPRCTKDDPSMNMRLGTSGTYAITYGDAPAVVHPGGTLTLEPAASLHAIARDEKKLAYAIKGKVIVRSLPAGTVAYEIATR